MIATNVGGAHRLVEPMGLVHNVRHLRELLAEDDGTEVGIA